jgi:hypothetical protein
MYLLFTTTKLTPIPAVMSLPTYHHQSDLNGVFNFIQPSNHQTSEYQPATGEVEDDMEGEQETIPSPTLSDEQEPLGIVQDHEVDLSGLLRTVSEMSKGVSDGTHAEYMRYDLLFINCTLALLTLYCRLMTNCEGFLVSKGLVTQGNFFSAMPHPNAPVYIVAWIMDR